MGGEEGHTGFGIVFHCVDVVGGERLWDATALLLSVIFGGVGSFWVCGVLRGRSVAVRRPERRFWWGGDEVGCARKILLAILSGFIWQNRV